MVPRTVAGNISRAATTLTGNISGEAMRPPSLVNIARRFTPCARVHRAAQAQMGLDEGSERKTLRGGERMAGAYRRLGGGVPRPSLTACAACYVWFQASPPLPFLPICS